MTQGTKHDTLSHTHNDMTDKNVTKADSRKIKRHEKPFGTHFV